MANTHEHIKDPGFPGYPHYPPKDDIMKKGNDERVDVDVEKLSSSKNNQIDLAASSTAPVASNLDDSILTDGKDEPAISEADISHDDLIALGEEDTNFEPAAHSINTDLDIPGVEDDDPDEEIGEEDEENNYYSIGGDDNENLEEDKEI